MFIKVPGINDHSPLAGAEIHSPEFPGIGTHHVGQPALRSRDRSAEKAPRSRPTQKFGGSGADPHSPQPPGAVNDAPVARPSDPKDIPAALANKGRWRTLRWEVARQPALTGVDHIIPEAPGEREKSPVRRERSMETARGVILGARRCC